MSALFIAAASFMKYINKIDIAKSERRAVFHSNATVKNDRGPSDRFWFQPSSPPHLSSKMVFHAKGALH
jgi:hypothetical protein